MMMEEVFGLGLVVKGKVVIEKRKGNIIVQRVEKENMWVDNGTKLCVTAGGTPTVYCCLGDTQAEPSYGDTSMPGVIVGVVATRTYERNVPEYCRHKFLASFAPPAQDRVINAVGLAQGSNGSNVYCWTRLVQDVVQKTDETLYVYYFVYVNKPSGRGISQVGWDAISNGLFYTYKQFNINRVSSGDWRSWEVSKTPQIYGLGYEVKSGEKYKKYWYGNVGSSGSLGTCLGRWYGLMYGDSGIVMMGKSYKGDFLGRVWAKSKSGVGDFFELNYLPTGWGRAVEVRPVGGGQVVVPAEVGKLIIEIMQGGEVGVAKYRVMYDRLADIMNSYKVIIGEDMRQMGGMVRVFNSDIVVGVKSDYSLSSWILLETGGEVLQPQRGELIIGGNGMDEVWVGKISNGLVGNELIKKKFLDSGDLTKVQESSYVLPGTRYLSWHDVGQNIWLYDESGKKWVVFDKLNGGVEDSEYREEVKVPVWIVGRGYYDVERGWIVDMDVAGLRLFSVGGGDVNGFTGQGDFTTSLVKNWSYGSYGWYNTGNFWHEGGRLKIVTSTGSMSGTTDTACVLYQVVEDGVFEATMYIEDFVPTVNYQELALGVKSISGGLSHKRIGLRWNGSRRIEAVSNVNGGASGVEGGVAFSGTAVRLKVTRDSNNVIRVYYSTSDISVPDEQAQWNLIGNQTYTLAGRVAVGIFALTSGGWTQLTGTVGSFRMNSGVVYKKVGFVGLSNQGMKAIGQSGSGLESWRGVVGKFKGNVIALVRRGIVVIDGNSWEEIRRVVFGADISVGGVGWNEYQSVVWGLDGSVRRYWWSRDGVWWNGRSGRSNEVVDVWREWDLVKCGGEHLGGGFYAMRVEMNVGGFGWNGVEWMCGDENYNDAQKWKVTHGDWQVLPDGKFEVRFLNNPNNPGATFSDTDKYEVVFGQKCLIKDNQQYVMNVGGALYYGDVERAEESYNSVQGSWVLTAKSVNQARWLTADFDWSWKFYFKNADGSYKYWDDVLVGLSVSEVVSRGEFRTGSADVSWVYNEYKDMYVEFVSGANAGQRRRILEYDGYYKKFKTEAFGNDIQVGDGFKIVVPKMAEKVTGITDVNQFVVNEKQGEVIVHSDDVGSNVEMSYLYVLRSW